MFGCLYSLFVRCCLFTGCFFWLGSCVAKVCGAYICGGDVDQGCFWCVGVVGCVYVTYVIMVDTFFDCFRYYL